MHRQSSIITDEGRDIRYRPSFWRIAKVNAPKDANNANTVAPANEDAIVAIVLAHYSFSSYESGAVHFDWRDITYNERLTGYTAET